MIAEDNTSRGCMLIILGIISLSAFLYHTYSAYIYCGFSPKKNPSTTGVIVRSSIDPSKYERRGYSINVAYDYFVGNHKYTSNMICCGTTSNDLPDDIITKYPLGSEVTVYYRESDPSLAVIEAKVDRTRIVPIATFGILFMVISGLSLYYARKD